MNRHSDKFTFAPAQETEDTVRTMPPIGLVDETGSFRVRSRDFNPYDRTVVSPPPKRAARTDLRQLSEAILRQRIAQGQAQKKR